MQMRLGALFFLPFPLSPSVGGRKGRKTFLSLFPLFGLPFLKLRLNRVGKEAKESRAHFRKESLAYRPSQKRASKGDSKLLDAAAA